MATLQQRIDAELIAAAKAHDTLKLSVVRMLKSAIKYKEIEAGVALDDAAVIQVVSSQIKQRRDSAEQFTAGHRPELASKENAELTLLQAYLPAQLGEAELHALVEAAVAETGAQGPRDMGAVMKVLRPRVAGQVEAKVLSGLIQARLSSK